TPAYTGGPTISEVLMALDRNVVPASVAGVWAATVDRGLDANGIPQRIPALQELADIKTVVRELAGRPVNGATVDIDEASLAASLAPLLTANLGALSDADVQRIAEASADEQAKRLAS